LCAWTKNQGLAKAFVTGLDACLRLKADIIVNTDADNQYAGCDIPLLIDPILHGSADVVIGDRQTDGIGHFSWTKKRLQSLGSWAVRQLSGTQVADATSGFRAISREAALQMNVLSRFTYTLETIIQAGKKNLAITDVPVHTNSPGSQIKAFLQQLELYQAFDRNHHANLYPLRAAKDFFLHWRFDLCRRSDHRSAFYLFLSVYSGSGHIQSLILAAVLLIVGFQVFIMALLADLISFNRQLLENVLYRLRKMESNDKP
jgi:glycosyltransferase involved in cell wall biosynthesis